MEPRQLWERNAVLAEAFCKRDERVRAAQGRLDEAQADRSRLLAAFAVTVGSDGAVARLFGLSERQVRVARRSVGRDDARMVADEHLATAVQPDPQEEVAAGNADAEAAVASAEPVWSVEMDAVLVDGWQTGVDFEVLAGQFGTDLVCLVKRVQQLAAHGRLHPARSDLPQEPSGRHRRNVLGAGYGIPAQQTTSPWDVTADPWASAGREIPTQVWGSAPVHEQSWDTAASTQDWEVIVTEWESSAHGQQSTTPLYQQPWTPYT